MGVQTVRPDHRVHGSQPIAVVQGRASAALPYGIPEALRLAQEEGRVVGGGEALEKLLHGRREPVVDLVAAGPQSIAAGGWEGMDLEHGVIRRHRLEGDVCVPARRGEAADVGELVRETPALLLLLAADHADLIPELAALLRQRMDVQGG